MRPSGLAPELPTEEEQADRDHWQRVGRRRLLDELERMGVPRYKGGAGFPKGRGSVGRRRLVAFYRSRNTLFRFLLEGTQHDTPDGRRYFLRVAHRAMPEPEAHLLKRWHGKRAAWVRAGCPADARPWAILEGG